MAEVNEHGVFNIDNCEQVELQVPRKYKITVIIAACEGKWYASYDYLTPDGGGGSWPSKRWPHGSREDALQAEILKIRKKFPVVRQQVTEEQLSLFG